MMHHISSELTRRSAIVAGGAALAALGMSRAVSAAPIIQSGGGIAGGGSVSVSGGTAQFSVFGSRFQVEGSDEPLIVAIFCLLDQSTQTLVKSSEVSEYGPAQGSEKTTRRLAGTATVGGNGVHPFVLTLVDGGGPGDGGDSIDLSVGADGATTTDPPFYAVSAKLDSGDLQLVTFAFAE